MNCFVFVVCGSAEHISTLNLSLKFLRRYSAYSVLVVTDSSRNEIAIEHDNIIDVETPKQYSHHEASIFLKTGLHKFVPDIETNKYCYLDSDIVAVSEDCNKIFEYNPDPVLFVKDHCKFSYFSPDAMNCNCKKVQLTENEKFYEKFNSVFPKPINFDSQQKIEEKENLDNLFKELKSYKLKNILPSLNYLISRYFLRTNRIRIGHYEFISSEKCWYNDTGEIVDFDFPYYEKKLKRDLGIYYKANNWYDTEGNILTPKMPFCSHLSEHISKNYCILIPDNWQHWNGGVFIFNHKSIEFLEYWHKITLEEFNDDKTKTRDQGTLAVAAWKFGLQDMKTMPLKFNFITEYANPEIKWDSTKGYTYNNYRNTFEPVFLHIYHHWGDEDWSIWQSVIDLGKKEGII
ncbi:MAG TPA: hypothetical protein PLO05_08695 [Bacteroidales bacterium]|nr:hypothetical protein [Bacteroidales bacterium]